MIVYVNKSWIFGSDSLLKFIALKRLVWKEVRTSYHELRWYKNQLEVMLRRDQDSFAIEQSRHLFSRVRDHWALIASSKLELEQRLHAYRITTPSKVEMMLYYEYLFHADKILKTCKEMMTNGGIDFKGL